MSTAVVTGRRKRRRLSRSEKYEIYVLVLTGQATQREAAERYGVDRSTVVTACRVARQGALDALAAAAPGRPGVSREQAALEAAQVGDRAGSGVASARGKSALGLTAGPAQGRR
jgi:transposase-like protein